MNKVNLGSKYDHRVTLRLSDEQYEFLIQVSDMLGVSPSDYLRMCVNAGMMQTKVMTVPISPMQNEVGTHENVKTDSHDFV